MIAGRAGVVVTLIAVSAAACSPRSAGSPREEPLRLEAAQPALGITSFGRLTVDLAISEPIRLRESVQISATARANVHARNVRLTITVPELAAGVGHRNDCRPALPVNVRFQPAVERTVNMAAGTSETVSVSVVFPVRGRYTVSAAAIADDDPVVDGKVIDNGASRTLLVIIADSSGTITTDSSPLARQHAVQRIC